MFESLIWWIQVKHLVGFQLMIMSINVQLIFQMNIFQLFTIWYPLLLPYSWIHYLVSLPCCVSPEGYITGLPHTLAFAQFSNWKTPVGNQMMGKTEVAVFLPRSLSASAPQFWLWLHPSTTAVPLGLQLSLVSIISSPCFLILLDPGCLNLPS